MNHPTTRGRTSPGLVDVHAHFLPRWYVEQARASGHATPDGMPGWPEWTAGQHLDLMDTLGIKRSLLSLSSPGVSWGTPAENRARARRANEDAADITRRHRRRFGFLASLPLPAVAASIDELTYALDSLHADGVILQTSSLGTYVSDPSHAPLWAALAERRCLVLLHPTSPPAWEATSFGLPRPLMEFLFDTTRVVTKLLLDGTVHANPGLQLVVPHSGSLIPLLLDRATQFQTVIRELLPPGHPGRDAPAAAEALTDLWWDLAGTPTPHHLRALLDHAGEERLLYGSDYCFTPSSSVLAHSALLDRSCDEVGIENWRHTLSTNAQRALRA